MSAAPRRRLWQARPPQPLRDYLNAETAICMIAWGDLAGAQRRLAKIEHPYYRNEVEQLLPKQEALGFLPPADENLER